MRRILSGLSALMVLAPLAATAAAHADPLFDFQFTAGSHAYDFALPNPPSQYDHPHAITTYLYGAGSEDGTSGYLFGAYLVLYSRGYNGPTITLYVTPPGQATEAPLELFGPPVTSETFVPVSYNPVYSDPAYQNLVISSFVPGAYVLRTISYSAVDVRITEEGGPTVTPEPSTWALLGTGAIGGLSALRRRARRESRPVAAP